VNLGAVNHIKTLRLKSMNGSIRQIYVYTDKCLIDTAKGKLSFQAHGRVIGGAYILTGKRRNTIQLRVIRKANQSFVLQKIGEQDRKLTLMARVQ
jgi:hypothetical protein